MTDTTTTTTTEVIISKTAEQRGRGTDMWKSVAGLTRAEKDAARAGSLVAFRSAYRAGGRHGTYWRKALVGRRDRFYPRTLTRAELAAIDRATIRSALVPVASDWSGSDDAERAVEMAWEWLSAQSLDYLVELRDELADKTAEDSGQAWLVMVAAMDDIEARILAGYARRPEFGHAVTIALAGGES